MKSAALLVLAGTVSALTDIEHKPFMRKNIDPIVLPGKYTSHMHSFYGSDVITKDLPTTEQLQKGCPSGENPNDLSIYCMQSLSFRHQFIKKIVRTDLCVRGTNTVLRRRRQIYGNLSSDLQNIL